MKLKKTLFFFCLLLSVYSNAQNVLWTNRLNGLGDNSDRYNAMAADGTGNYYLTGYTYNPGKSKDFLTVKINSAGDTLWTRVYNHSANLDDEANYITLDAAGNILVTGASDGGSLISKTDFLTIKYDVNGNQLWASRYNYATFNEDEAPTGISTDASNNIYVTGRSDRNLLNIDDYVTVKYNTSGVQQWVARYDGGSNKIDRPVGIVALPAGGCVVTGRSVDGADDDIVTICYDNAGTQLWLANYDGLIGNDRPEAIALDGAGNIFVAGSAANNADNDYVTLKYNSAGVQQWAVIYSGVQEDKLITMKIDGASNVYVTGQSDMDPSGKDNFDFKTIKYNSSGIQQWIATSGNAINQEDTPENIFIDNLGNVYLTGKSDANASNAVINYQFSTVKYNSLGVQQWISYFDGTTVNGEDLPSSLVVDNAGNVFVAGSADFVTTQKDAIVLKYNAAGVLLANKSYNGIGDFTDKAKAMVVDKSNNTFVTGYTISSARQKDLFVQRINSNGKTAWSKSYDRTGEGDEGNAIAVDTAGSVYVTGYSNGTGTFDDYVTQKYSATGNLAWSSVYNFTARQDDKAVSIVIAPNGDCYVTGYSDSDPSLNTNYDFATIKYNSAGLQQWVARYNGSGNGLDKPVKIELLGSNVIVTGTSYNLNNSDIVTVSYDQATGLQNGIVVYNGLSNGDDEATAMTIKGNSIYVTGSSFVTGNAADYVTVKYTNTLSPSWVNLYNGTGDSTDRANCIVVTNNAVYVNGISKGSVTTGDDMVLLKIDNNTGSTLSTDRYTGTGAFIDEAYNMAADTAGNIYSIGRSETSTGISNYITTAYSASGTKLLTATYNGTALTDDIGKAIALDGNGNVLVSGYSSGLGNASYDFTTLKYCAPIVNSIITAGGPTTFCAGGSVLLSATSDPSYTYIWKKGSVVIAGATSSTYLATTAGKYKAIISNTNGCSKISNVIKVIVNCRENGSELLSSLDLVAAPNPFNDLTTLQWTSESNEVTSIELFNLLGKQVWKKEIVAGTTSVEVGNNLPTGVYFAKLLCAGQQQVVRIVKL